MDKNVSIIIGGLYPSTAKSEYLEARRHGVLFISLSPVDLPRSMKNHLLIEVPGSIQSQIETVFKPEVLNILGKRVAAIYPDTSGGKVYARELWDRSLKGGFDLASIYSFSTVLKDYRDPVSKLLGLYYKPERREEFNLWEDIYAAKGRTSSIRRIQTLKPIVDFDWVYIPVLPSQAKQIIPTFSYYDANKLKFVGNPSWLSRSLVKSKFSSGEQVYFR